MKGMDLDSGIWGSAFGVAVFGLGVRGVRAWGVGLRLLG